MTQRKTPPIERPASPCIQVCRPAGDTCVGCLRTLDEIARWSRMSDAEREAVWQRLDNLTENAAQR